MPSKSIQHLYSTYQIRKSPLRLSAVCSAFHIAHFRIFPHTHRRAFAKGNGSHSKYRVYTVLLRVTKTPRRRRWIKIDNAEKQPVLLDIVLCESSTKHFDAFRLKWRVRQVLEEENWYWFSASMPLIHHPSHSCWTVDIFKTTRFFHFVQIHLFLARSKFIR